MAMHAEFGRIVIYFRIKDNDLAVVRGRRGVSRALKEWSVWGYSRDSWLEGIFGFSEDDLGIVGASACWRLFGGSLARARYTFSQGVLLLAGLQ